MVVLLVGLLILILGVIVMCLCGLGMEVMVEVSWMIVVGEGLLIVFGGVCGS